jgi:hypothetical protein
LFSPDSHADYPEVATSKPTHRSRVTNGSQLLPGVDGRSLWARRCRDLIENHIHDRGGPEALSEAERSIIRRASVLTVELEMLEQKFATCGEATPAELDLYSRLSNTMRRLLESVGLQRRTRDISPPSLSRYLDVIPAPLASLPAAVTLDPVPETHEEPAAVPEPLQHDLGVIPAGVTDGEPRTDNSPGFPLAEPEPIPGQLIPVDDSRASICFAPRHDGTERWAIIDADNSLKGYAMDRSEAERICREKLRPMRML